MISRCVLLTFLLASIPAVHAQDQSRPGINDSFRDPIVTDFTERFEVESREIFAKRNEIVVACELKAGQTIADIGAGTGLFTRLFAAAVKGESRVVAVDIAPKFLEHIRETCREARLMNVETLQCTADSTELPPASIDVAFICDTYHHFEFPSKTMASLHRALKRGGRVILIDFRRVEGTSSEWTMNHVRAGQEVFEAEVIESGFKKLSEQTELLKENYFVVFEKLEQ
jgi:FkbM family methyltransferase